MAGARLASFSDLATRMGPVADVARAEAALDDASALIHLVSRNAWVDGGVLVDDVPGVVKAVCCSAARRVLENPLGVSNQTETIANFSHSETFVATSNDVYLTKQEITRIRQAAGLFGVGTVSTTRGEVEMEPVSPRTRRVIPLID
jgi:hypothetical protein